MSMKLAVFLGTILGLMVGIPLGVATIDNMQAVQATGGAEIIGLVIPMIDETVKSIKNNDTEKALSQLDEIRGELSNTFFEEEED